MQPIRFLLLIYCAWATLIAATEPAWSAKPVADWTEQDARQVLEASPWAKIVVAGIARRETEAERRGEMAQPHGVGYDGIDDRKFDPRKLLATLSAGFLFQQRQLR